MEITVFAPFENRCLFNQNLFRAHAARRSQVVGIVKHFSEVVALIRLLVIVSLVIV